MNILEAIAYLKSNPGSWVVMQENRYEIDSPISFDPEDETLFYVDCDGEECEKEDFGTYAVTADDWIIVSDPRHKATGLTFSEAVRQIRGTKKRVRLNSWEDLEWHIAGDRLTGGIPIEYAAADDWEVVPEPEPEPEPAKEPERPPTREGMLLLDTIRIARSTNKRFRRKCWPARSSISMGSHLSMLTLNDWEAADWEIIP